MPRNKRISQTEWDLHKADILALRRENVPIVGDRGIASIMQSEHGFRASKHQYELQIARWKERKNLSVSEWECLFKVLRHYESANITPMVYMNSKLLSRGKLQLQQRRCRSQFNSDMPLEVQVGLLPKCVELIIETAGSSMSISCDSDTETINLSIQSLGHLVPVSPSPARNHAVEGSSTVSNATTGLNSTSTYETLERIALDCPEIDLIGSRTNDEMFADSNTDIVFDSGVNAGMLLADSIIHGSPYQISPLSITPSSYQWQFGQLPLPLATTDGGSPDVPMFRPPQLSNTQEAPNFSTVRGDPKCTGPTNSFELSSFARQVASITVGGHLTETPYFHPFSFAQANCEVSNIERTLMSKQFATEQISESLMSDATYSSASLYYKYSLHSHNFTSETCKFIIYLVENKLCAKSHLLQTNIIDTLKQDQAVRYQLLGYLQQVPRVFAKELLIGFMELAINAGYAPMVELLLQLDLNSRFHPDDLLCGTADMKCTALIYAIRSKNLSIVRLLLSAGADPNGPQDVLREALKNPGCSPTVVKLLLDNGASVLPRHIATLPKHANSEILDALLHHLSRSQHKDLLYCLSSEILGPDYGAVLFAGLPQNIRETQLSRSRNFDSARDVFPVHSLVISWMVDTCQMCCGGQCLRSMSLLIDVIAIYAAETEDWASVRLLADFAEKLEALLSYAVKSNSRETITFLLQRGAKLNGSAIEVRDRETKYDSCWQTPLSEAIRMKNDELVRQFEDLGALDGIECDEGRFCAAIYAAAGNGNAIYIKSLLAQKPEFGWDSPGFLSGSVRNALMGGFEQVAITLLDAGATCEVPELFGEFDDLDGNKISVVTLALRSPNLDLLQKLLRNSLSSGLARSYLSSAQIQSSFEEALKQKDMSAFNLLLDTDQSELWESAVLAALNMGRREIVDRLNHGRAALPSRVALRALRQAIKREDVQAVGWLLGMGADPADEDMFASACAKAGDILQCCFRAFSSRYPQGLKCFGSRCLVEAISRADFPLVTKMLELGFDIEYISAQPLDDSKFSPSKRQQRPKFGDIVTSRRRYNALGSAINLRGPDGEAMVTKVLDAGADPNMISCRDRLEDRTPLLQAIEAQNEPVIQLLIGAGADMNHQARYQVKRTPLQLACEIGSMVTVNLLLSRGAQVDEKPAFDGGATSLQLCAIQGYTIIAKKLLDRGANVHEARAMLNGRTAFAGAAEYGRLNMIHLLWDHACSQKFSPKVMQEAIELAKQKKHHGCHRVLLELRCSHQRMLAEEAEAGLVQTTGDGVC